MTRRTPAVVRAAAGRSEQRSPTRAEPRPGRRARTCAGTRALGRTVRRVLLPAVLAAVLVLIAACAQMPTSGGVGKSRDGAVSGGNAPQYIPPGPREGATPQSIIEGFFNAGSGYQNDFTVARQFLSPASAVSWKPSRRTLVYRGSATVVPTGRENEYRYELDLAYAVDADGTATPYPEGTREAITVSLVQVDGQWRLSRLPDGTAIPEETFKVLFKPFPVYFFDPSFRTLVPDIRWFIDNSGVAKSLVSALLAGPAPYLRSAVASAFPPGTQLERESVPIVDSMAQVDLTSAVRDASFTDRQRMHSQLVRTFSSISSVVGVSLRSNQSDVALVDPTGGTPAPEPATDPAVPPWQVGVAGRELVRYADRQASRIEGLRSVAQFSPRLPAAGASQDVYAFLGAGPALYSIVPNQPARLLDSREQLSPPSVGPTGWVWAAGPGADGVTEVVAHRPGGTPEGAEVPHVDLRPSWLAGRSVEAFRVARDGTRALVLSSAGNRSVLQLTGIVRSPDGTPRELTEPITLARGTAALERAVWVDETTILVSPVSDSARVAPLLVSLNGGEPRQLPALDGIESVSAGNGEGEVYAQTPAGVFQLVRTAWVELGKGIEDPSFPG
ncbi:LpqB family beta-propeller domain-containing protein [Sinomonas halotolerans]|uniref:LpqB family beta-propeller domain-containing protein n=1 Tax=Sinomonas halotolerans TaxID=1644133 RepID=A0ABU9WWF7_9MICC